MPSRFFRIGSLALAVIGLVIGLLVGGGQWKPMAVGLPDAGQGASWI